MKRKDESSHLRKGNREALKKPCKHSYVEQSYLKGTEESK
jgi:hypothetical protein